MVQFLVVLFLASLPLILSFPVLPSQFCDQYFTHHKRFPGHELSDIRDKSSSFYVNPIVNIKENKKRDFNETDIGSSYLNSTDPLSNSTNFTNDTNLINDFNDTDSTSFTNDTNDTSNVDPKTDNSLFNCKGDTICIVWHSAPQGAMRIIIVDIVVRN
ncbi:hypothetical protein C1645_818572 [Glomus cerebriforme]|uniref:Uncharacterized protein n=1 Tax=Glomus cerebriforme TaxID=658196 RepID=A0A397T726_9GLOM|nr:hypothetical protein C1645_818572 [Glomus cerebriforme]